jgi:hypothetical protein
MPKDPIDNNFPGLRDKTDTAQNKPDRAQIDDIERRKREQIYGEQPPEERKVTEF